MKLEDERATEVVVEDITIETFDDRILICIRRS